MESTMMASEKRHLRMQVRRLLADIPEEDQYVSDDALFARFLALPEVQAAKTVFCFWGIPGKEPDTSRLVEQLVARGKTVCLPRMLPGHLMETPAYSPDRPLVYITFGTRSVQPADFER